MKMQERKVREERTPRDFYTGSLKPELHPVCQGNLSLTLHYFKSLTKYPPLHFQNMQKHHKRLLNHTRITLAQQEPSCRPGKPPGTHTKLEKDQTLVVAQPILPQTTFSKLQELIQELIQDQSSIAATRMMTKERVSRTKSCSKMINRHLFRKSQLI